MEEPRRDSVIKPTCPEGYDYRQLTFYLRSFEEGIPDSVWQHIQTCDVCQPKWQLLESTDPIVKAEFESRVLSIADQVVVHEHIFHREGVPDAVVPDPYGATEMEWLSARALEKALAGRPAGRTALQLVAKIPGLERIRGQKERLEPEFVVGICDHVRSTPDDAERKLKATVVAKFFHERLERDVCNQTLTIDSVAEMLDRLTRGTGQEQLSVHATEVAAIFPETAFATNPPLLTLIGGKPVFNSAEFRRVVGTL